MKRIAISTALAFTALAATGPAFAWIPGPTVGTIPSSPPPEAPPAAATDEPPAPPSEPPPPTAVAPTPTPVPVPVPVPVRAPAPKPVLAPTPGNLLRPSMSPRRAHPLSLAFVAGMFATTSIPFPLPHIGVTLGVNLGPWLMVEGGLSLPIPLALVGARVFFTRDEVTGYVAGRYGFGTEPFIFAPSLGFDVSRDDGTYAFAEGGLIWDRRSSLTTNQVGNSIGTVEWVVSGVNATFGLGKRF